MPRVNPYRTEYEYNYEPSPWGALFFVTLIAAILLAAFLLANYAPQPTMPGQVSSMNAVQPFAPHTTSPSTGG